MRNGGTIVIALALGNLVACAQIRTTSSVTLVPGDGPARQLEPRSGVVASRTYRALWWQTGGELRVALSEVRECSALLHAPVVRVERIERRPDASLIWEYALGAALGGFSAFAFTHPDVFGTRLVTQTGEIRVDPGASRRVGISFAVISGILLASAVYDTARSIDTTVYADAYRVEIRGTTACNSPVVPVVQREVELVIDDYTTEATTDDDGEVKLALPPSERWAVEFDAHGGTPWIRRAAVRIDRSHAVAVDFRIPYDAPGEPHRGRSEKPEGPRMPALPVSPRAPAPSAGASPTP